MKFVHAFWSKPLINDKFENKSTSIRYILTDFACSAAWIHRCGYKIVLFTDKIGAQLLDFIPYDNVTILSDCDDSMHFAARFKFEALKQMELGDVLIDGDLIIRKRSTCKLIEQDINDALYSFVEPHKYTIMGGQKIGFYKEMLDKLSTVNFEFPYELPKITNLTWPNTSLLRFTNQEFKDEYIKQYEKHIAMFSDIDFGKTWPDIIIEQYFLKKLGDNKGYTHEPMFEGFPSQVANNRAIEHGFTHLGACKNSHNHIVEKWLKEANPLVYRKALKKINELLKNNQIL